MNQSEYKIRNLESSIIYIQEEYANTLKLLHEEIKDLQMKNSELSFQIAMQNVALPNDINSSEHEKERLNLLQQVEQLKAEVQKLTLENESKLKQLESYDKQVHVLSNGINKLKQSQKDEMVAVETELNNKSAEIVLLSTKLHNWKKYEIKKSNSSDQQIDKRPQSSHKPVIVPQMPAPSKIFKIRNQISVHPDEDNLKRRPIIARHATISSAYPMKNKSIPPIPECAVSTEEISNFSKSIKRPNILPPINSTKNDSPSVPQRSSSSTFDISIYPHESTALDSLHTCCEVNNYDVVMRNLGDSNGADDNANIRDDNYAAIANKSDTKIVHVDIDKFMDLNNSCILSSPSQQSQVAPPSLRPM